MTSACQITCAYYSCSLEVGIVGQKVISALVQTGVVRFGNINPRVTLLRVCVCV